MFNINNYLNRFDAHIREILFGGAAGVLVKLTAAAVTFYMNILLARTLGASEVGLFFLALTVVTILAAVGRMGLDHSVVKFIANASTTGDIRTVNAIYSKSMIWAGSLCIFIMLFFLLTKQHIEEYVFRQPGFGQVFFIMIFALPLIGLYTLHSSALQGMKMVTKSSTILLLAVPLAMAIGINISSVDTAKQASIIYLIGCLLTLLLGFYWFSSAFKSFGVAHFSSKQLLNSCLPLWGVTILTQTLNWSSQILLGVYSDSHSVALFAAAQRTAMLTSFLLLAINVIVAPKLAALHSQGDSKNLRNVALWSVRLLLIIATPMLIFILLFNEWLMSLFGHEFVAASKALIVLAIGQFVNIATGSVAFLLSMTGHERKLQQNVFVGAIIGIFLGIILIPEYNVIGASIATAVAVALQNLLSVYYVKRLLGFNTLAFWR